MPQDQDADIYGGYSLGDFPDGDAAPVVRLVKERILESHVLSYKQVDFIDKGKGVEICREFCSFFNSAGGVIVVGVEEDGHPRSDTYKTPAGIRGTEKRLSGQWLQDVLVNGIAPPAPWGKIQVRSFPDPADPCLTGYVIYVPASESVPHQVVHSSEGRYYKRGIEGRIPMLHYEILDMLGRRQRPNVVVEVPRHSFTHWRSSEHNVLISFWISVHNSGRAPARSLSLRLRGATRPPALRGPNPRQEAHWRRGSTHRGGWYMAWEPEFPLLPGVSEDLCLECTVPVAQPDSEECHQLVVVGDIYAENVDPQPFGFFIRGLWREGKHLPHDDHEERGVIPVEKLPEQGTSLLGRWESYE